MKRLLLMLSLFSAFLWGQTWQTINNVNHVYDLEKAEDRIYFSSWGGVVEIQGSETEDLSQMLEIRQYNTGDGLVSNDIRCVALVELSQSLWMGSSSAGISIYSEQGMLTLAEDLGLPSLRVNKIIEVDDRILVATSSGLAMYYYLSGVTFPLMLNHYNEINTNGALPNSNVTDMLLTEDRTLYLAHNGGVSYVALDSLDINSAWHSLRSGSSAPSSDNHLLTANSQTIALGISGKIYLTALDDPGALWTEVTTGTGDGLRDISALKLSETNELWLGYGEWDASTLSYNTINDTLLTRLDLNTNSATHWTRDQDSFGHNAVSRIRELDGMIYLGTWGDGIARLQDESWEYYSPDNIAFRNITMSMADQNNTLWFCNGVQGDIQNKGISALKDGSWQNYQPYNSNVHSNNIVSMGVDSHNRKWFGSWDAAYTPGGNRIGITILDDSKDQERWIYFNQSGMREWNEAIQNWGPLLDNSARLLNGTISAINQDQHGNMLVVSSGDGINVLSADDELIGTFEVPSGSQRISGTYHNGRQYFICALRDVGLAIWNDDSIPQTNGPHWLDQIVPDLQEGTVYGVASVETPYSGWQHFIASGNGLYMWDESNWYRYDVYIKRHRYNFSTRTWENDTLYYEDEERIFGSVRTPPSAIYGDPFGRVWVGSEDNGITMYDPAKERFTNYYQDKDPLLSNGITSLGYDPLGGRLLIGTVNGLNTLKIGRTEKPDTGLRTLKAFPNPFYPNGHNTMQIVNLPLDSMPRGDNLCRIFDASGALVIKLRENPFARFEWDGRNKADKLVSSGVYYFVISDKDGNIGRGKIAIIR